MSKKHVLMVILAAVLGIPLLGLLDSRLTPRDQLRLDSTKSVAPNVGMMEPAMMPLATPAPAPDLYYDERAKVGTSIAPIPPVGGGEGFTPGVERTVVKTASVALLVQDTRQAVDRITTLTTEVNGTVTNSNVFESEYNPGVVQGSMVIRVPVDQLESTLAKIRTVAEKVTAETINADDRTEQKVDLDAQLKNLRATEEQLLTILRQAQNVEETLQVQRELTNVRDRIERFQAQLDNLVGDATMSTISVSLSTKESELPLVEPARLSIWEEIRAALRNALTFYRNLFVAGLRLAILALPALLLAGLVWLFWRRRQR